MSNVESPTSVDVCGEDASDGPVFELVESRPVVLTPRQWIDAAGAETDAGSEVLRYLPTKGRRMVGAWCFLDLFGPADVSTGPGMRVAPHPHCGLQTVTWLLAGEVRHRDSLGNDQLINPGQLNLMTAGQGISHAENSPVGHGAGLHGIQLWVALPESDRNRQPDFAHHENLPVYVADGLRATVLLGELAGIASPAAIYTPLMGAELSLQPGTTASIPLRADWEYAVLVVDGEASVAGRGLGLPEMVYLGCGRSELPIASTPGGRVLLLGGEPFTEEILMWWNFVARSHDEIAAAREEWMAGDRFGTVVYEGQPLAAPPMPPVTLRPRGRR
jgi:quercetin 2,3-dioxygenase